MRQNWLLAALPPRDYQRLRAKMVKVRLLRGQVLFEAGDRPKHVYFPDGGLLSLQAVADQRHFVEIAQIGNDGIAGVAVALHGTTAVHRVTVQVPATASRIRSDALLLAVEHGESIQRMLLCYAYTLFKQMSQSAVCQKFHTVEQRLSRRLLATKDRVGSDTLDSTHALTIDTPGVGQNDAASAATTLQDMGLIRIRGGAVRILNRRRLERMACECYGIEKHRLVALSQSLSRIR